MEYSLQELADEVGGKAHGQSVNPISSVATIQNAGPGCITFLANRQYFKYLGNTKAEAVILSEKDLSHCPVNAIVVKNPYLAYAKIATLLNPVTVPQSAIHSSAVIAESAIIGDDVYISANVTVEDQAQIGEGTYLGPGCVVGQNVTIGKKAWLVANVTLCHDVQIGDNVILHPGVVIGADGFGIANDNGEWNKVPQLGTVHIANNVEIGANTTVDRGALEDTIIEEGVKLDNQIQVAHNVKIGAHTAIAGCTGIAGSTTIGSHCAIGGAVSIVGHLDITDNVQITAASMVTQNIKESGLYSSGTPLQKNSQWHRNFVRFRKLDEMAKRIKKLEKLLEEKTTR